MNRHSRMFLTFKVVEGERRYYIEMEKSLSNIEAIAFCVCLSFFFGCLDFPRNSGDLLYSVERQKALAVGPIK